MMKLQTLALLLPAFAAACSRPPATAAADHMAMPAPATADSAATKGFKRSMASMMSGAPPYTGDADIDFNRQMRVHHLAAIDMAQVEIAHGSDPGSKALAERIITEQRREIAQIDAWLKRRGR